MKNECLSVPLILYCLTAITASLKCVSENDITLPCPNNAAGCKVKFDASGTIRWYFTEASACMTRLQLSMRFYANKRKDWCKEDRNGYIVCWCNSGPECNKEANMKEILKMYKVLSSIVESDTNPWPTSPQPIDKTGADNNSGDIFNTKPAIKDVTTQIAITKSGTTTKPTTLSTISTAKPTTTTTSTTTTQPPTTTTRATTTTTTAWTTKSTLKTTRMTTKLPKNWPPPTRTRTTVQKSTPHVFTGDTGTNKPVIAQDKHETIEADETIWTEIREDQQKTNGAHEMNSTNLGYIIIVNIIAWAVYCYTK